MNKIFQIIFLIISYFSLCSSSSESSSHTTTSSSSESSNNYTVQPCNQLDSSFFVQIPNGNFESGSEGWDDPNGVIQTHEIIFKNDQAFEGIGFASFSNSNNIITSFPIQFPNYTESIENERITNLFKTINMDFKYEIQLVGGSSSSTGSDSSFTGNAYTGNQEILKGVFPGTGYGENNRDINLNQYSKLDLRNIENNKNQENLYNNSEEPDYLELLIDDISLVNISTEYFQIESHFQTITIDIFQFLDGNNHTIKFLYHNTGYYDQLNISQYISIDYINFILIPITYIDGDIYVSMDGDDIIGNGSMANSFCSIQRAIYSIQSGNNLIFMDESFHLFQNYYQQPYVMDNLGKEIHYISNISMSTTISTTNSTKNMALCNAANCYFEKIILSQYSTESVIIVSQNSHLYILASSIESSQSVLSNYSGIVYLPTLTNLTIYSSFFNFCGHTCIYSNSEFVSVYDTELNDCTSVFIIIENYKAIVSIDRLTINGNGGEGILLSSPSFNTIALENIFIGDLVEVLRNTQGMTAYNGHSLSIKNMTVSSNTISFSFKYIRSLNIQDFSAQSYDYGSQPLFSTSYVTEIIIDNLDIQDGTGTEQPYLISNSSSLIFISNLNFVYNPVPFMNANNIGNLTIENANLKGNSKLTMFFVTNSNMYISNLNFSNCPNQLISSSTSSIVFNNIQVFDNFNLNTNLLEPLIYLLDMKSVSISYLTSSNNLNFELIKLVKCGNVSLSHSSIDGQLLGNIFGVEGSNFTIYNTSFINSFLATDWPIHVENSYLNVTDCFFFNNTQYFYIENSDFNITDCQFENIITVSDSSYYISSSSGTFRNVTIGPTDPHLGIVIQNSVLYHIDCNYLNVSSYNNTIGLYIDSEITFYGCQFINNAAASNLMTFQGGKTTFNYCLFDSLSSLDVSILKSFNQTFLYFNTSIIQNCQSNGNGIEATITNALFENSIVGNNSYLQGHLFKLESSNISFCNITHQSNQANYYIRSGYVYIELFYANSNYFPDTLFQIIDSHLIINESIINDNTGQNIINSNGANVSLLSSMFHHNELVYTFLNLNASNAYFENVTFHNNLSTMNGSCFFGYQSDFIIISSNFTLNSAVLGGVGTIELSTMKIEDSYILNNTALSDGNDISDQSGRGGFLYLSDNLSTVSIFRSEFNNNNATHRGAVFYISKNGNTYPGSVSPPYQIDIVDCVFNSCTAQFGPGGVCFSEDACGCKNDSFTQFNNNVATYGNQFASTFKSMSILPLINGAHPNTYFTVAISLLDFCDLQMGFLDFSSNYTLTVLETNNNNNNDSSGSDSSYFREYTSNFQYEGYEEFEIMIPGDFSFVNTFTLKAQVDMEIETNSKNSIQSFDYSMNITLSQCNIGYEIGPLSNCTPCPIGYYGYNGKDCYKCNINQAICPGKSTIYPQSGYWISLEENTPPDIYSCDPAYCLARECREGQNGTVCSVCEPGYSKVKMFCQKCNGLNWEILSGIIVFSIAYIFVLSSFSIPSASIIFNYLTVVQVIAVVGYNIEYLTILPLFGLDVDYWPETCLDPKITYLWKQTMSLGLIFLVIIPISIKLTWCRDLIIKLFPRFKVFVTEFFDRNLFNSLISFLLIFYSPITYISLALVSCTKIGKNYYLSQDPSVQCFTNRHIPLFILSLLLVIFISIGVPLFIFIQIRRKNRYFCKIFFEKYRPSFIWWDLILLLRSNLYIIVTFIFAYKYMYIKGLVISTLGLFFTFITWLCQPYKSQYKNDMETYLSLILCLSGIMINTRSFNTTEIFSGIILSLSGIFALIPIAICIQHIIIKIYPTGLQSTNPATTKIRSKSGVTNVVKSINEIGFNQSDSFLI